MDQQSEALAASMHAQLLDPNLLAQLNASAVANGHSPLSQLQVPGQHRAVHDEPLGSPPKKSGSLAKEKHSATEKRRRDRIAEGLTALREVVIPGSAKEDQAGFLKSAANYIRHLQEALSYLQAMGAVQKLPEDVQWSIRAMLMRRLPNTALLRVSPPPASSAAAAAATDAALPQLLGFLLQQMSKDQGGQDGQQLQTSMAQAALMHQMQNQYQSYMQQCVQAQQTPSPTPGQEQLQQLMQQQLQPPRQSTPSLPHNASSTILAPPQEQ